ncbi:protein PLASTID MOVEMENT IMPAIRED 2 [Cornus florida]|uniref:protein PLASTID MOVEMENT IMPAIRED 2 n=1 Tax=Cornus florida TaxID=4283 RepID=UPI002898AB6B|nr:protein PLASTID MOVEMENT IMPAIRED 2 [Cornus florida]XP_059640329.1 protein PLASTID MOVEMENT IMPAIRED 2 [Cornus florida]
MDRGREIDNRRRIGSVKSATNLNGERVLQGNPAVKKPHMDFSEKPTSRTRELHQARRDIGRFNESRRVAESEKAQAESELFSAKMKVRDLTLRIEESSSKAKAQIRDLEKLKKPKRGDGDLALAVRNVEDYQYAEVMRELEYVKQELSKLKLDMASVLEEKKRAEKESEASSSKLWSYSSSVEALKKEIEEVNGEQVLVELARIEALKELGALETHRKEEANQYSSAMEETRKKIDGIAQEIDRAKELETKLDVTTSDVNVLQRDLNLVKQMDKRVERNEASFEEWEEMNSPSLLKSVSEELEKAKKELASIREEGFQFMASMDVIRSELKHVSDETARLKKTEEKRDLSVQNLNSKLLRAKTKLEAASAAEEKATEIVSNLSFTLDQLKTEAEAAKKEKELISEETVNVKTELQKTESEIDLAEERLQAAMQDLEAVKTSETTALDSLRTLTENAMRARASVSQHSSTITISTFEYEYLTGGAGGAEEIADKKVAAAQAWIEALKASEKEILMKTEMAHREIRELKMEEEQVSYRTERSLAAKRVVEGELQNWREEFERNMEAENFKPKGMMPRKSMYRGNNPTPIRRTRSRMSASPAVRTPRTPSFNVKRRRKVMPTLAKLFSNKSNARDR